MSIAFTAPTSVSMRPFSGSALSSCIPLSAKPVTTMSVADVYIADMYTKAAKGCATPYGVFTPQCTEGSGGANTAEASRLASLAATFRLRQAPMSVKYRDLYATRRAAIVNAAGSHVREGYAVKYPAAAWAGVKGKAEALKACSRYFGTDDEAGEYMFECVDRQYKATKVVGGVYSTLCADGRIKGEADTARVAAKSVGFRSGTFGAGVKTQMRYDAGLQAIYLARGCHYEEEQFVEFKKMSAAMRYGDGSYAASCGNTTDYMSRKLMTVEEQIQGVNLDSFWPSNLIRPAIKRKMMPWDPSPMKSYAYMSEAAVAYGIKAQENPFQESGFQGWSAGWKPKSSLMKN